jgi:hypothetical protein
VSTNNGPSLPQTADEKFSDWSQWLPRSGSTGRDWHTSGTPFLGVACHGAKGRPRMRDAGTVGVPHGRRSSHRPPPGAGKTARGVAALASQNVRG